MTTDWIRRTLAAAAAAALLAAGCGGDDDTSAPDPTEAAATDDPSGEGPAEPGSDDGGPADGGTSDGSGGGSGTLVLDDETVELSTVRCHLETQPAAAGGGNIEFVVQGEGTDADGESVMIDISRYDEESMFAGDDVQVYVGDVTTGEATELSSTSPAGTVSLEGSSATAEGITLEDLDAMTEHTVSFDIDC